MIHKAEIIPNVGIGSILLGMEKKDVENVYGIAKMETSEGPDRIEADYEGFSVRYSNLLKVEEVELYPESEVTYNGANIFNTKSSWKSLIKADGNPQEISGTVVLLKLGISMWADENEDESNKSLVLFVNGVWDRLEKDFKPYFLK